ncbi:NAD(P)H-dependent oxidoreductase [Patescibacteria group bacterium]|nr:NAD(P)H-dependent oxidoreductase [Patescibacteria group bacterium]
MDLYESAWKQDYLLLDERRKPLPDPYREQIQDKISRANEIVFCFPLRWFDAPAILKNRFDTNMTS